MIRRTLALATVAALAAFPVVAVAGTVTLGTAGDFAVLAGASVTNTGPTVIAGGSVGVSPGSSVTGFPPGSVLAPYTLQTTGAVAATAQDDLVTAYVQAAGLDPTATLTGQDLGGMTLQPGTYFFATSAQLTGALTLDFAGDPDAQFVFQIGSTLTTASGASVLSIGGGAGEGCNVYWQVGSSAVLGTDTAFQGHILALTSITLNTRAEILGSALARNGSVTLDTNLITNGTCNATPGGGGNGGGNGGGHVVPLPSGAALGLALLPFAWLAGRRAARRRTAAASRAG